MNTINLMETILGNIFLSLGILVLSVSLLTICGILYGLVVMIYPMLKGYIQESRDEITPISDDSRTDNSFEKYYDSEKEFGSVPINEFFPKPGIKLKTQTKVNDEDEITPDEQ